MMKQFRFSWLAPVFLLSLGITTSVHAANPPANMPSTVNAMGTTLHLNGVGLRTATIFHVKVYEAGLYLRKTTKNPQQILASTSPKVVRMKFLHDVNRTQMRDAWKDSFKNNCVRNCQALQAPFQQFLSKMPAVKSGALMVFIFTHQGLRVLDNNREIAQINNPELATTLLSTWIGKSPPSKELKEAMLGIRSNIG